MLPSYYGKLTKTKSHTCRPDRKWDVNYHLALRLKILKLKEKWKKRNVREGVDNKGREQEEILFSFSHVRNEYRYVIIQKQ